MACVPNNLGCQILGCAAERIGLSILYFLSKPKIHQLEVPFCVYEDVFGFQVAVCDTFPLVEEF
jgi:hypothetical protein